MVPAFILGIPTLPTRSVTARQSVSRRRATPVICASQQVPASNEQEDTTVYNVSDYQLDTDVIRDKAMGVVSDVGTRPMYYGKILGYAIGALISFTVLKAIVTAVDSLPVLPGALELIGLGYSAWFVWRYVLFKESRQELLEEIDDFMGRAKPGPE